MAEPPPVVAMEGLSEGVSGFHQRSGQIQAPREREPAAPRAWISSKSQRAFFPRVPGVQGVHGARGERRRGVAGGGGRFLARGGEGPAPPPVPEEPLDQVLP